MDISTDKAFYEFCLLIDSSCENLDGTKLLLEYWNRHKKLIYFNSFCSPSSNWVPSHNEIQYLVRIETVFDNFVHHFDNFLKSIKRLPQAESIPPDKIPYLTELINELSSFKNIEFTNELGTFCEQLEKKTSNIYKLLEKIGQYTAQANQSPFITNFTSGEDFISRTSQFESKIGKYFIKIS